MHECSARVNAHRPEGVQRTPASSIAASTRAVAAMEGDMSVAVMKWRVPSGSIDARGVIEGMKRDVIKRRQRVHDEGRHQEASTSD